MTYAALSGASRRGEAAARPAGAHSPIEQLRRTIFWPFVMPALTVMGVFYVLPVIFVAWLSLNRWAGFGPMRFVGLDNYRSLATDPSFQVAIVNTFKILLIAGSATFLIAFALTLVLRQMPGRFFARSVLFFPNLVNAAVFAIFAGVLFNPNGLVNQLLGVFGVPDAPKWLAPQNQFALILAILTWTSAGYFSSIIMSAVDQIPRYYYEAASLDGAGPLRQFFTVTLPLSWEVVSVCAILWTMSSVKVFELILVFGGTRAPAPPMESWTTAMFVYLQAFQATGGRQFGIAAAGALVSLLLVAVLTFVLRRLLRREVVEL